MQAQVRPPLIRRQHVEANFEAGFVKAQLVGNLLQSKQQVRRQLSVRNSDVEQRLYGLPWRDGYAPFAGYLSLFAVVVIDFVRYNMLVLEDDNRSRGLNVFHEIEVRIGLRPRDWASA